MFERKLLRSNILLVIITCLLIINSILLECLHGATFLGIGSVGWVWMHVVLASIWAASIFYHLYLHWGNIRHWFGKMVHPGNKLTMLLAWLSLILLLTGIAATVCVGYGVGHTPIGGIHGKIGLFVMVLMVFHLSKRWKWFKNRRSGKAFRPIVDNEKCVICGMCLKKCPAKVFEKRNKRIIASNTDYCLQCRKCVLHCPKQAIRE